MTRSALVVLIAVSAGACARGNAQVVPTACGAECGGCCDGNGRCLEGNATDACGLDGVACTICASGCFDGQCSGGSGGAGGGGSGGSGGSGGGGGAGGGGELSDACPPDGWCLESPAADGTRLTDQHLRSVFAINANDVWAVGDRGTALHWDGAAWTNHPTPGLDDLFAVYAFSPNDVWAVGGSGWPTGPVGVAFHWDGVQWTEKLRGTKRLESLWGATPNDLWAGGYEGELQRWDGAQWKAFASGTTESITAMHGRAPNKAWAAGSSGLVMSWNGTAWTVIPNNVFSGYAAVWAFSDDLVWVLGGNGTGQSFNGTSWQALDFGQTNTVLGFWGSSTPAEGWGVGPDTLVRFATTATKKQSPTPDLLIDVHGVDPHNLWAVGFKGTVMRYRR